MKDLQVSDIFFFHVLMLKWSFIWRSLCINMNLLLLLSHHSQQKTTTIYLRGTWFFHPNSEYSMYCLKYLKLFEEKWHQHSWWMVATFAQEVFLRVQHNVVCTLFCKIKYWAIAWDFLRLYVILPQSEPNISCIPLVVICTLNLQEYFSAPQNEGSHSTRNFVCSSFEGKFPMLQPW